MDFMRKKIFHNRILLNTLMINVIFAVLYFSLFEIQYEQDDGSMALIAYNGDEHLVFINIIIGYLLKFLLIAFPQIAWYFILQMMCIFISFTVISYVLIARNQGLGTCMSIMLLMTFGYNAYVYPQFTKTSVLLTLAGLCILYIAFLDEKINILRAVSSFALLGLGICYRRKAFLMTCACLVVFVSYTFAKKGIHKSKKFLFQFISVNIIIFICCLSTKYVDTHFYQGEEWKAYKTYSSYRSTLLDYDFPSYEENYKVYDEVGLTEEDIKVFKSWNIADTEVFDVDSLRKLAEAQKKEKKIIDLEYIITFIREMISGVLNYPWIISFFISLLYILISAEKSFVYVSSMGMVLSLLEFYLYYSGRVLLNRIQYGIFLTFTVANLFYVLEYGNVKNKKKRKAILYCFLILFLVALPEPPSYEYKKDYAIYALQDEDVKHVYFDTSTAKALGVKTELWESPNKKKNRNYMQFGSWTTYLPTEMDLYKKYDISNMYRDIVNNGRVYLNDSVSNGMILNHIKRHYDEDAELIEVKNIDGIPVYRVVSDVDTLLAGEYVPEQSAEINREFVISQVADKIKIEGYAYFDGKSSYQGNAYAIFRHGEEHKSFCMTLKTNTELRKAGDLGGAYSKFVGEFSVEDIGFSPEKVIIIYENNGDFFDVGHYVIE